MMSSSSVVLPGAPVSQPVAGAGAVVSHSGGGSNAAGSSQSVMWSMARESKSSRTPGKAPVYDNDDPVTWMLSMKAHLALCGRSRGCVTN